MEQEHITTPFGRRPLSLGMLANQMNFQSVPSDRAVEKWQLFRTLCEARGPLGISDRALAVMNALLTFYPKQELSGDTNLVVFPSNAQLSVRAHGIAPATLRRHLAVLVEAGLILRKDSPNGKRYSRRDKSGEIEQAFGFSLAPLLARADEISALAAMVIAERQALRVMKERLTLCRRDIAKLIDAAIEKGIQADWNAIRGQFSGMTGGIPRTADATILAPIAENLEMLRDEIVNILENYVKTKNMNTNESQNERHIQNSNTPDKPESEPRFEQKQGENPVATRRDMASRDELKSFPLSMVLRACPEIMAYGPGGQISNWRDLMMAAVVVRSMLGVSPSAYQHACEVLGAENAATVIACILEKTGQINSAGGYLRDLTRRAEKAEFSLGPMLMALLRANGSVMAQAG